MILTFDVVGSEDSMVLLLLISDVDELVLVSEIELLSVAVKLAEDELEITELVVISDLEPLPNDVGLADKSEVDELKSAEEIETSEVELVKVDVSSLEVDEESLGVLAAVELDGVSLDEAIERVLAIDVIERVGGDVDESPDTSELDVDTNAAESLELAEGELISRLVEL